MSGSPSATVGGGLGMGQTWRMTPAHDPSQQSCIGMTVPGRAVDRAGPLVEYRAGGRLSPHPRRAGGDAELVEDGEADPFAEDAFGVAGDLFQEGVVDRGHREEGGAGLALDARVQRGGFLVEAFGAGDLESHEVDEGLAAGAGEDVLLTEAVGGEVFAGEVGAAGLGVLAEVAEDVGELERDAALDRQGLGLGAAGEAPDVDARDADDAGDAVAVLVQVVEGVERRGAQVLVLAGDRGVEQLAGDAAAVDQVGEGRPDVRQAGRGRGTRWPFTMPRCRCRSRSRSRSR